MKLAEAFNSAKQRCTPPTPEFITGVLDANHGIDSLDVSSIECLWVKHDYVDFIPELSIFPNLKAFKCIHALDLDYIARQNFLEFTNLSISVNFCPANIRINAPQLKKLYLYVQNNESDQTDLFSMGKKSIDLSLMPHLEEIELRHCSGYDIIVNSPLMNLYKAIYADCRYMDFDHLRYMPNLSRLFITGCHISDLSFLHYCRKITYLDLSYNDISDASVILTLPNLEKTNLYRNPLQNSESLSHILSESILSAHDKDINGYLWELCVCANSAYLMTKKARVPDKKRSPFYQRIIDRSTDEELFAYNLELLVWDGINKCLHGKHSLTYKSVTPEEMFTCAIREYPFIADGLIKSYLRAKT